MAHHKKLSDEALASDYVVHQNACADRKLQKHLDHLERLQTKQRRRLEKEEHYFTVLHQVVPLPNPGDETNSQAPVARSRPELQKRFTVPKMAAKSEQYSPRVKSGTLRNSTSSHIERETLNLKDNAYETKIKGKDSTKQKLKESTLFRRHTTAVPEQAHLGHMIKTNACKETRKASYSPVKDLFVTGSQMGEKRVLPSQRAGKGNVSARTKCMQYLNENESYLHDVDSLSLKSMGSEDDEECSGSMASNYSNASERLPNDEEKLPNIDKVGFRLMGYCPPIQKMNMLYQLKDGRLDVPRQDNSTKAHRKIESDGGLMTFRKLSLEHRKITKSLSLDSHRRQMPVEALPSDQGLINVTHMTLVKFLPKSKQALYLKYDCNLSGGLRKSWHAGDNM